MTPSRTAAYLLTGLLLATDALLIALYAGYGAGWLSDARLQLIVPGSWGESFQYLKELWLIVLLAGLGWRHRSALCGTWLLVFAYILCDDIAELHERAGVTLSRWFSLDTTLGSLAEHAGEGIYLVSLGMVILLAIVWAHQHATTKWRNATRSILYGLFALAFFGVFMDAVHALLPTGRLHQLAGVIEDGGEQVVMSGLVGIIFDLTLRLASSGDGGAGADDLPRRFLPRRIQFRSLVRAPRKH